jgi:hypothetical protein
MEGIVYLAMFALKKLFLNQATLTVVRAATMMDVYYALLARRQLGWQIAKL